MLGTGISDRVFTRGDADVKIGRAIWVITCWFLAPVIAIVATGCIARLIYHLSTVGLALAILVNVSVRYGLKRRADAHERRYHSRAERQADDGKSK